MAFVAAAHGNCASWDAGASHANRAIPFL